MGRRDVLLLSIFTLITVLGWIVFDVYHASVDSTIPQNVEKQLVPITPKFDTNTLESVHARRTVEPLATEDAIKIISPQKLPKVATSSGVNTSTSSASR